MDGDWSVVSSPGRVFLFFSFIWVKNSSRTFHFVKFFFFFYITRTESRSVGFEPTTLGFGDPRSTELN